MRHLPGGEALDGLVRALCESDPVVGVRINRRRGVSIPANAARVPWAPETGFIVRGERPRFTMDPALHQGLYYVQDPSSMIVGSIVEQIAASMSHPVYIDACAAPGGKTTAAIDALSDTALVIANEFDRKRAEALRENIVKWGYDNVVVSRGDTSRIGRLGPVADIIAVDVPCSGEGMMRKDDDAVSQWSSGLVDRCAALQREIVANVWPALKPGGFLIYSTCTFNIAENEDNIRWIIEEFGATPVDITSFGTNGLAGAIGSDIPALRFIPGRIDGEGLFVAVLRRPGESADIHPTLRAVKDDRVAQPLRAWLNTPDRYLLAIDGDCVYARRRHDAPLMRHICDTLDVLSAGVEVGHLKGRDYQPSHAAALAGLLGSDAVKGCVEVDYHVAIAYLRGEAVSIDAPRGIVMLTYGGFPLGLVKNVGNRANNLYPAPWCIKSSYLPDTPPAVI